MTAMKYLKCSCDQCGGRIEYPAEAAGTDTVCPHCGRFTNLGVEVPSVDDASPRRTWLVWAAILVVTILGVFAVVGPAVLKHLARNNTKRAILWSPTVISQFQAVAFVQFTTAFATPNVAEPCSPCGIHKAAEQP